ncbi:uncharacterized protein LOC135123144 isoform X2 [Zophobas morio]
MDGEELYSVKWYLNKIEFFRYMPRNWPYTHHFPAYNDQRVEQVVTNSNFTSVVIIYVSRKASGLYTCEVSGDAPSFATSASQSQLQVVVTPEEDPYIETDKLTYNSGETVTARCISYHSNPAVNITWNTELITEAENVEYNVTRDFYYTTQSEVKIKIPESFTKHTLKISCLSKMYDAYNGTGEKIVKVETQASSELKPKESGTVLHNKAKLHKHWKNCIMKSYKSYFRCLFEIFYSF